MVNKYLLPFIIILLAARAGAQPVTITESGGWLESAYVKWLPYAGTDSFSVYYSGEGVTDRRIDDQLIRNYGTYFRADILGLKAGKYAIKVVPVISGGEGDVAVTDSLTVEAHDRSGFAFSNGRVPGAYKADGTLKDGAVVLYITENTKNNITLSVTGANANPCIGLQTILEGFKKGQDNRPLVVRLVGQITDLTYMDKGDVVIENNNNASGYITLEGVGDDAVADGWGIRVKNASNIEIRNIGTMNCNSDEGDNISLQQDNDYIWVHHCDFFYGQAGTDADQVKGDGALDSKRSGFVTLSYNHFWDSGKSNLLGNGIEDPRYLTYHHNWYDHSDSRHPRVRCHSVHVYNNYYDGNSKYGVGTTNASSVFVEANYFRHCKYPLLISMQGSDVWDESAQANDYVNMPTFSSEDGGSIKAYNNFMTGQTRFVPYGDAGFPNSTVDFDAYVTENRNDTVGISVVSYQGGNTYNNFDINPAVMYPYEADSPEAARENVMKYAGRLNGGDFKWTFNNAADDISYDVDPALKSALVTYKTSMISVQGDGEGNGGAPDTTKVDSADLVHNYTLSGTGSTFFSITGNLSDSKGTVIYDGLTLTLCLKIESVTLISFMTEKEATLTLVFNDDFNGAIKINDTNHNASAGKLILKIPAGSYRITKADIANLYYMSVFYDTIDMGTKIPDVRKPSITLFPNPVVDIMGIATEENLEKVEIYGITGVLLQSSKPDTKHIDMSKLQHGSYLVRVYTPQNVYRQIIIKK